MTASSLAVRRRAALIASAVVACAVLAALAGAAPALAKSKTCADQVVADWYDNQRVDRLYPTHCYREAIAGLGPDIKDYTGAEEAILRAMQYREAGKLVPRTAGDGSADGLKPIAFRNTSDDVYSIAGPQTEDPGAQQNTSGPSSVPIPLIVLAGLAGLLLVAGGAGYVARRVQARRGDPPSTQ